MISACHGHNKIRRFPYKHNKHSALPSFVKRECKHYTFISYIKALHCKIVANDAIYMFRTDAQLDPLCNRMPVAQLDNRLNLTEHIYTCGQTFSHSFNLFMHMTI